MWRRISRAEGFHSWAELEAALVTKLLPEGERAGAKVEHLVLVKEGIELRDDEDATGLRGEGEELLVVFNR